MEALVMAIVAMAEPAWVREFKAEVRRLAKLNPDWYQNDDGKYQLCCSLKHLLTFFRGNCVAWGKLFTYICHQYGKEVVYLTLEHKTDGAHRMTLVVDDGVYWLQSNRDVWRCSSEVDMLATIEAAWPGYKIIRRKLQPVDGR